MSFSRKSKVLLFGGLGATLLSGVVVGAVAIGLSKPPMEDPYNFYDDYAKELESGSKDQLASVPATAEPQISAAVETFSQKYKEIYVFNPSQPATKKRFVPAQNETEKALAYYQSLQKSSGNVVVKVKTNEGRWAELSKADIPQETDEILP